jgi:hypothetical protein
VEDTRLSWAARGLLAYLLSRSDDWKVLVNDLKKRGNLGRDGIYALLRELRSAGYVRFERHRDPQQPHELRADIPSEARMTRSQNGSSVGIYPRPLRQSGNPHVQQPKGGEPTPNPNRLPGASRRRLPFPQERPARPETRQTTDAGVVPRDTFRPSPGGAVR